MIYKICPASAWREAERQGVFRGSPVDLGDGYIHFSTASQVAETARKHFFGQTGLFLIAVDADVLGDAVRPRVPPRLINRGRDCPSSAVFAAGGILQRPPRGQHRGDRTSSSRWSLITRKSLITRAPSAIAHARSAKTRPLVVPPRGEGSAADRPAVSPVRSAS